MSESEDQQNNNNPDDGPCFDNGVRKRDIKKGYIFLNICTIALGFMQYGFGMACWTNSSPAFARKFGWDSSKKT